MLDSIRTLTDLPPDNAVRFSEQDLAAARRRRELQENAQRQAREIVRQATVEAEQLRNLALQQGYGQGLLRAARDLVGTLIEGRELGQQLQQNLADAARQLLGELLHRDEVIDEVLGNWLREHSLSQDVTLQIVLPERLRAEEGALIDRLHLRSREPAQPVRIDYHPQERYLLRLADQVLEFDLDATQEHFSSALLARTEHLPDAPHRLDACAHEAVETLLRALIADAPDHNNKEPENHDRTTVASQLHRAE
ncbi:oxygen-regulated invasion protein OrgB [Pseudomonas sp. NPDC090202]|uniref:oxygen-regulated invasion protein OrgB n=1 Tax=unclassified Pseudomonas TaxID=196821 RepID=UPI0037FACAB1